MALIRCPECGREISSNAATCPHCGNPMRRVSGTPKKNRGCGHTWVTRSGCTFEGLGTLLIIIGIVMLIADNGTGGILLPAGFVIFLIGRFM